jgi:trehalose/maltose hydrolase-like predicted phosphorylase
MAAARENAVLETPIVARASGEPGSEWSLVYRTFDPSHEGVREALCALGNGYFGTRGSAPWARADGVRYPGVYLAGGYDRLRTHIAGRDVETEDLVNLPNWLHLELSLAGSEPFDERAVRLRSYRQELDIQHGLLLRTMTFEDDENRRTTLCERRFVSMANKHLAALEVEVRAENWSGTVGVRAGVDGRLVNSGAKLYARFNNHHLEPLLEEVLGEDAVLLLVHTAQSNLQVAEAVRTQLHRDGRPVEAERSAERAPAYAAQTFAAPIAAGETLRLEKMAVLYTSRDAAISEPAAAARKAIQRAGSFDEAFPAHTLAWRQLWERFDVRLQAAAGRGFELNVPMLLRLNLFHLLQTASPNSIGLDIGVPARGWTGEAYQGHIFWDELFIFPTIAFRLPEIARSLLLYRYRRLDEARAAAARDGFQGAMFPWQSGSDGREETQAFNLNPRSERWVADNSFRQRHVGSAIAWNVWQYLQITDDREFLLFYGAELLLEIARFWASIADFDEARGRYVIHGVMGPDEFHEGYPDAPPRGVNNNAYTNVMAVWVLSRALDILGLLDDRRRAEIVSQLGISAKEIARWDDISRRMFVPFHEGLISQFEGYERLAELDWDAYRTRYANIQRLELILEAEGDSANRYKLSKQADVLMLFYLFSAEELGGLFARLGYRFEPDTIPHHVAYYDARCSHGSTLSRVVSAWVLARSDRPKAITYLADALLSDIDDIQGGTSAEGVHLGAMAGTVDLVLRSCTGIEVNGGVLRFSPQLPERLEQLELTIRHRGHTLDLQLTLPALAVRSRTPSAKPIRLAVGGEEIAFAGGAVHIFRLPPAAKPH